MASSTGVAPETPVRTPESGSTDGSLTELAALEAARDEKRQLLDRAAEAAVSELGQTMRLPAGCAADDVAALLRRYYWSEPAAEVLGHEPAELAALALGHLRLAEVRPPGSATVDVQALPDGRAVVRLVTDDMPYLVDSVTAEVIRQGFALAHIVHPVVVVRRDLRGRIRAFCDSARAAGCGPDALAESWMGGAPDGPLDDEAAGDLIAGLRMVLDDVRAVDEDAERVRARVLELAGRLDELAAAGAQVDPEADAADDPAEAAALLRWLAHGNFVFLGARDADLTTTRGKATAKAVPGSGLGVLRSDTDMAESETPEAVRAPGRHLLAVTKADARSTVYRRAWLDLVAVNLPAEKAGAVRQHRFVGLFPSAAYTSSVLDVPLGRRPVPRGVAVSPRWSPAPGCRSTATPARSCSTSWRPIRATSCCRSPPTSCCRWRWPCCTCRSGGRPGCSSAAIPPAGSGRPSSTCPATGTRPRCGWPCRSCCRPGSGARDSSTRPGRPSRGPRGRL